MHFFATFINNSDLEAYDDNGKFFLLSIIPTSETNHDTLKIACNGLINFFSDAAQILPPYAGWKGKIRYTYDKYLGNGGTTFMYDSTIQAIPVAARYYRIFSEGIANRQQSENAIRTFLDLNYIFANPNYMKSWIADTRKNINTWCAPYK